MTRKIQGLDVSPADTIRELTEAAERAAAQAPRPYSGRHYPHQGHLFYAPTPQERRAMYVVGQSVVGHDRGDEDRDDGEAQP